MCTTCVLAGSNAGTVQVSWTTREPATSSASPPASDAGQRPAGQSQQAARVDGRRGELLSGDGQRHRHRGADRGDEQERAGHEAAAHSPPSHPHHGIVRDGHRTGSVRRRASSATSSTEIVSAATRKLNERDGDRLVQNRAECIERTLHGQGGAGDDTQRQPARRDGDRTGAPTVPGRRTRRAARP